MTTTPPATPTDRSTLPQFNGRPVPWVTRWTGEVDPTSATVSQSVHDGSLSVGYADGRENREQSGVLWIRNGLNRSGEPQYAEVNAYRQRRCMTHAACQVCGAKINERPIRWLLAGAQLLRPDGEENPPVTYSPPTCEACIPLALELCPYLRRAPYLILKVLDYVPWGVYGSIIHLDTEGAARETTGALIPYFDKRVNYHAVIARQLAVRLTKFVVEETGNG